MFVVSTCCSACRHDWPVSVAFQEATIVPVFSLVIIRRYNWINKSVAARSPYNGSCGPQVVRTWKKARKGARKAYKKDCEPPDAETSCPARRQRGWPCVLFRRRTNQGRRPSSRSKRAFLLAGRVRLPGLPDEVGTVPSPGDAAIAAAAPSGRAWAGNPTAGAAICRRLGSWNGSRPTGGLRYEPGPRQPSHLEFAQWRTGRLRPEFR